MSRKVSTTVFLAGLSLLAGARLASTAVNAAADASASATAPSGTMAQWRTQKLKFDYSGFTALYTCDGLEGKVKQILLTFGARKDLTVRATGCNYGSSQPSKFAWVTAEFTALAPATDPAPADAVKAGWEKVQLAPNRPTYMGAGECELVEQIRDLLQKGFTLRNTAYRTQCVPHQVSIADYSVSTEVLKPVATN
ncbi:MAG: hypothetical protein ACRES2_07715 [Steroidobacteraceae bacterium]